MFGWLGGGNNEAPIYPELEAPQSVADFKALNDKKVKLLVELLNNNDGWTETAYGVEGHNDIKIVSKQLEGESVNIVKTSAVINASAEKILNLFSVNDVKERQKLEHDLLDAKVLKEIDETTSLYYSAYKSPAFPVSDREFTNVRHVVRNFDGKDGILICLYSVNYKEQPTVEKRVRAVVVVSGIVIQPVEGASDKCNFTRIVQLDPKGNIPTFVVNMFVKKSGDVLVGIRKTLA
jgi:hypothetical protein